MLIDKRIGGARVVIEEFLDGEEASFIVHVGRPNVLALATSQDHKRLLDGDRGPNTGGMGAYSPAPIVTPTIHARVLREIIMPTLDGMAAEGIRITGFLYAGLMIDAGWRREDARVQLPPGRSRGAADHAAAEVRLGAVDRAAIDGRLDQVEAEWDRRTALGVVIAAAGLPERAAQGRCDYTIAW